ncbi:MAG: hypothetical protein WDA24_06840 [Tissierellales bacterium]
MKKRNIVGFTLIEVIFSMLLLGIIAVSVLPMAAYSVKYVKWNNIRLTALNLAYTQVEWLKTLDYEDLGLDITGYSPKGIVRDNYYMNNTNAVEIEGVNYLVQTGVYWEKAESTTGEPVPQAMKKIDVVVEAQDTLNGEAKEYSVLGLLVSREGERIPTKPGHVKIYISLRGVNTGTKNVTVGLGQLSPTTWYANTDDEGMALIGDLPEGNYLVQPSKWKSQSIMVEPNGVNVTNTNWTLEKNVIVPRWDKNKKNEIIFPEANFNIDLPGYIILPQGNKYPELATLEIKPSSSSYVSSEGQSDLLIRNKFEDLSSIKFWRLWAYDYTITFGEENYYFINNKTNNLWDGRFSIDDLDRPTYEELKLAFGLENNGRFKITNNGSNQSTELIIEFSSHVTNIENMKFTLNGEEIDRQNYTITHFISGNKDAYKILLSNSVFSNESLIEFHNY